MNTTLLSTGALGALIVAMVAIDERAREAAASVLRGAPSSDVLVATATVREFSGALFVAARDQSLANAPLTLFVVVATVLMLCMVRS